MRVSGEKSLGGHVQGRVQGGSRDQEAAQREPSLNSSLRGLVCFWGAMSSSAQGCLLALSSPRWVLETIWGIRGQTQEGAMKSKHLACCTIPPGVVLRVERAAWEWVYLNWGGGGLWPLHTLAHSRARCLVRLALRSSAYRAPMKEPMDVPPTRSTGTPASSKAFSTPMWEQPLQEKKPQ